MDNEIKKDLASNWFKLLQNAICDDIIKLENKKVKFKSTTWKRSKSMAMNWMKKVSAHIRLFNREPYDYYLPSLWTKRNKRVYLCW